MIKKYDIEELKTESSRYALTPNLLSEFLDNLKNSITANSNLITDANKEDVKVNKKQIKIKKLIEIIDSYQDCECVLNSDVRKMIIYKGDPYLTLHICLQAFTQQTKIILLREEFMLGVNEVLTKIFNKTLSDFKIDHLIDEIDDYNIKDIEAIQGIYDEIIAIGDTAIYQTLKKEKMRIKFFPYNNIIMYCDSNDLLKLQEAIYIYANENQFEIEIINNESFNDAIKTIQSDDYKNTAVLLTKSNENRDMFVNSIEDKDVYVNDNPFKQEVGRVYNYLI